MIAFRQRLIKFGRVQAIFFLFCRDLTEKYVMDNFHKWKNFGHIDSDVDLELIIPIIISYIL